MRLFVLAQTISARKQLPAKITREIHVLLGLPSGVLLPRDQSLVNSFRGLVSPAVSPECLLRRERFPTGVTKELVLVRPHVVAVPRKCRQFGFTFETIESGQVLPENVVKNKTSVELGVGERVVVRTHWAVHSLRFLVDPDLKV